MSLKIKFLFFIFIIGVLISSCSKKGDLVARVGWFRRIHQAELDSLCRNNSDTLSVFNNLLKSEVLYKAAYKTKFVKKKEIKEDLERKEREWYKDLFLDQVVIANNGFVESELKEYYEKNKSLLDGKNPYGYDSLKGIIEDSLIIKNTDLNKAYTDEKSRYEIKAHAKLSHIFTKSNKKIKTALEALHKGMSFTAAVQKYSEDTATVSKGGFLGDINQGDINTLGLGVFSEIEKLIFGDSTTMALKSGEITDIIKTEKGFHVFHVDETYPQTVRKFEDVVPEICKLSISRWKSSKDNMIFKYFERMKIKYKISIKDTAIIPAEEEINKYYEETYKKGYGDNPPPLSSARKEIINIMTSSKPENFAPDFVFARGTRGFKVTAENVADILKTIPLAYRGQYNTKTGRERIVNYLVFEEVTVNEAKACGFVHLTKVKKDMASRKKTYLSSLFERDFINRDLGFSENELKLFYKNKCKIYWKDNTDKCKPFEDVRGAVACSLLTHENNIKQYYLINAEQFAQNDTAILPFDEVKGSVSYTYMNDMTTRRKEHAYRLLKKLLGVKIYKENLKDDSPDDGKALYKLAQDILSEGKDAKRAEEYLLRIRYEFPKTINGADVCFMLGQVYTNLKDYQKSLWEYEKLIRLYPKSDHNYKSQFMIGYIYSEYLQNLDKAKAAYEKVIKNYPKSDLADDAEFMIKYLGQDLSKIDFLKSDSLADTVKTEKK